MSAPVKSRPRVACEVAPDRVIAARALDRGALLDTYATQPLASGVLAPGLSGSNVLRQNELREAIRDAMDQVGGRARELIAVIPDAAVRVMLLDFDTLPQNETEAASIVRFRLRKSLPFDVDHAALSYDARRSNGGVRVVAAVAPLIVIEDYEQAFRDAGYSPGVIMPSMLATLGIVDDDRPTMVVKVNGTSISVAIADASELRLFRTLENPAGAQLSANQLASEIYPSAVFFEDTFGRHIESILVGGVAASELASALQDQTNARVEQLSTARYIAGSSICDTPGWVLAGVAGALVG